MNHLMIDDQYDKMPWNEIDAVVFDVGQVLLRFVPQQLLERIVPERPDLHSMLHTWVFQSPYWVMMDRGLSVEEAAARMTTRAPQELAPYIRRVMENWIDLEEIAEGVRSVHTCKAHGKKLYVLSNYSRAPFEHALHTHGFFQLFDDLFISSHHQLIKPDPAIYTKATQRFALDPARTLFIDDNPANIEGCLRAGWQGLCYNRPGKLDAFFAE
ncbi:MAG: HAD family phosphatase [Clostridiales bacterium]|nr:HAD family phosphatase [Clostridiales bacterium]